MSELNKDELLLKIYGEQAGLTVSIDEIKKDLREHIRRTAQNELLIRALEEKQNTDINYVKKHIYYVQGAAALIGLLATAVVILSKFEIV